MEVTVSLGSTRSELVTPASVPSVHRFHITECHHTDALWVSHCLEWKIPGWVSWVWFTLDLSTSAWHRDRKFINSSSKLCLCILMTNLISFLFLILAKTVFIHHSYSSWILYELHFYSPTAWTVKHPPPTLIWLRTIKESNSVRRSESSQSSLIFTS